MNRLCKAAQSLCILFFISLLIFSLQVFLPHFFPSPPPTPCLLHSLFCVSSNHTPLHHHHHHPHPLLFPSTPPSISSLLCSAGAQITAPVPGRWRIGERSS